MNGDYRRPLDLAQGPAWSALQAQLQLQERLLAAVRGALPEALASHCRHCVPSAERLLVYVDSPGFASQLRFYSPTLLIAVEAATDRAFRELRVRNLLPLPLTRSAAPVGRGRPGANAGAAVRASAETAASDELRDALLRLGRTLDQAG